MDEVSEWTMDAHDVSAIPLAPSITFRMSEDLGTITATPPGGTIVLSAGPQDVSRIVLTNALTGEVFADILSTHVLAASLGDAWNTVTQHACEVAAALYWSMWRRQQIRATEVASTPEPELAPAPPERCGNNCFGYADPCVRLKGHTDYCTDHSGDADKLDAAAAKEPVNAQA